MSFSINAGTLFVGAFLFIIGVFLKPAIMVLRDKMVWWWIEKYLVTDQLDADLSWFRTEFRLYLKRFTLAGEFIRESVGGEEHTYILKFDNNVMLNADEFNNLIDQSNEYIDKFHQKQVEFAKKSNLLDSLVKHYSQDVKNLIEERRLEIKRNAEENRLGHEEAIMLIIQKSVPRLLGHDVPK